MVRARTNRVVMSQRDIRQTTEPEPSQSQVQQPAVSQFRRTVLCTWCRANSRHYACLAEASHSSCMEPDCIVPPHEWANSAMHSEGWVPASGPCCDDCLEAAFDQRTKSEGMRWSKDLVEDMHSWCSVKGERVCHSMQKGWKALCGWLERSRQRLKWRSRDIELEAKSTLWNDVTYEAEGFLELKVVVTRQGVMQHLEIDFPTDVAISRLKIELQTLIDVPPASQTWYIQAHQLDDSKTLGELKVEIGAVLEVKCQA